MNPFHCDCSFSSQLLADTAAEETMQRNAVMKMMIAMAMTMLIMMATMMMFRMVVAMMTAQVVGVDANAIVHIAVTGDDNKDEDDDNAR